MSDDHFSNSTILVSGLGVIGGSIAKSLWKAGCNDIYAYDRDESALRTAKADGVIRAGYTCLKDAPMFDIVICCLPPSFVASCYTDTAAHINDGGVFAELSGLKTPIIAALENALQDGHELLSLHPMAGSEKSGYAHSYTHMFADSVMILTSSKKCGQNARRWGNTLSNAMACKELCELTAARHDEVIAHVSHIPHIAALAIKAMANDDTRFAGGSYQALTRVSDINSTLWAGLLTDNREYLQKSIAHLKEGINAIESAIMVGDAAILKDLLDSISKK